jgi:hypothetical protein
MALLPLTAVALRLVGFWRWQVVLSWLTPGTGTETPDPPDASLDRAGGVVRMVQAASRHGLTRANCLEQSLVLWYLLRRRGLPTNLRVGVRKAERGLHAHAWVELGSVVLNDARDVHLRYVPFERDIMTLRIE